MANVSSDQCEDHRRDMYTAISKKPSTRACMWLGGILVGIMLTAGGVLLATHSAQKVNASEIKGLEDDKAIERVQRRTERTEQKAWQEKADGKFDTIIEKFLSHKHP